MRAVEKAIWYIENHYREQVTLEALALGYSSHEAFTRAFKAYFSFTPEEIRTQGHTDNLKLIEAKPMLSENKISLAEPRIQTQDHLRLVGISRHYPFEKAAEIPDQWQSFAPSIPRLSTQSKPETFGVIFNADDESFDYLTAIAAEQDKAMPSGFLYLDLAPQFYAVFAHHGHVAQVRETCDAIWSQWLPESDYRAVEAPWFERYGTDFDPLTGNGGLEIWIPVIVQ